MTKALKFVRSVLILCPSAKNDRYGILLSKLEALTLESLEI